MRESCSFPRGKLTLVLLLLLIPIVVFGGALLFQEKHYAWIALCVALLSCLPLFICFERKGSTAKELTTLAVLVAVSAAGRFAFVWVPGFKPVTAITVIAAMYLGREAGFVVGSLSAVVSNFYFGQGPWTPFQMFAWGFLGFLAGILAAPLKRRKLWMILYGVLAGLLFSVIMDVWATLWADGTFNLFDQRHPRRLGIRRVQCGVSAAAGQAHRGKAGANQDKVRPFSTGRPLIPCFHSRYMSVHSVGFSLHLHRGRCLALNHGWWLE